MREVPGLRPRLTRALAAIPWRRIPKKVQAPMTGVVKKNQQPQCDATL